MICHGDDDGSTMEWNLNGCPEALEGGRFEDIMALEDMNPAQILCLWSR